MNSRTLFPFTKFGSYTLSLNTINGVSNWPLYPTLDVEICLCVLFYLFALLFGTNTLRFLTKTTLEKNNTSLLALASLSAVKR